MEEQRRPAKRSKSDSFEWRIYPAKNPYEFNIGDRIVLTRWKERPIAHARGTIIKSTESEQKVQVSPKDDAVLSTLNLKDCKRILPDFEEKRTVVVTAETNHFRQMVCQVHDQDRVLEIGCSTGETSKLLIPYAMSWVGFDTSEEMISQCRNHLVETKQCHIVKVDALIDPFKALEEAQKFGPPSVVFLDIGGNRESISIFRMVSWILDSLEPRLLVIKSRELAQSIQTSMSIHQTTGIIENGDRWFLQRQVKRAIPKHPLRAPLVLSPQDHKTPICRYHNYHKDGCKNADCPLDHSYCHACQQLGHIARNCPCLALKN